MEGASFHRQPEISIWMIPLITRRSSTRGLPPYPSATTAQVARRSAKNSPDPIIGLPSETLNHNATHKGFPFMGPSPSPQA